MIVGVAALLNVSVGVPVTVGDKVKELVPVGVGGGVIVTDVVPEGGGLCVAEKLKVNERLSEGVSGGENDRVGLNVKEAVPFDNDSLLVADVLRLPLGENDTDAELEADSVNEGLTDTDVDTDSVPVCDEEMEPEVDKEYVLDGVPRVKVADGVGGGVIVAEMDTDTEADVEIDAEWVLGENDVDRVLE